MGSDAGFVTLFYVGNDRIGQVRVLPQPESQSPSQPQSQSQSQSPRQSRLHQMFAGEIRASGLSQPSERCLPLTVLHMVSLDGVWFKLESATVAGDNRDTYCDTDHVSSVPSTPSSNNQLHLLHSSCLQDAKTAVVPMSDGVNELHLVAMKGEGPCFWAFCAPRGLYNSCLAMLNLRCLAMVFDLDETLILANTQRSFDDRIEALRVKIHAEKLKMGKMDGQRVANMVAELERYQRDRLLLKQFADNDFVVLDNGRVIRAQMEEVPPHFEGAPPIWRPVIRIPERNIIFTRIHPNVRDTSILVKLRPAWEELRNYVIARGRKRFEVFICTMSEKDYALEMWRLLDPDARLVDSKQLLLRLLCVKAGSKKSLSNMFQYAACHRKMAMVIDDRPDVWEDEDQQQVHVVPAFSPYYAPGAETNAPMPILCIARNVASNVRGGFFKDFDETLTQKFAEINYDTDVSTLPTSPHVGTYLSEMAPSDSTVSPGLRYSPKPFPDGMAGAEVTTALEPQLQPNGGFVFNTAQGKLEQQQSYDISTGPATDGGWLEDEDETGQDSPSFRNPELSTNNNNASLDQSIGFRQMENKTTRWPAAPSLQDEESSSSRKPELDNVHIRSLQELAQKCNASVEYKCSVNATTELLFTHDAYFEGNRVGRGVARTSREAKVLAAQDALKFLERAQISRLSGRSSPLVDPWNSRPPQDEVSPAASTSGKEPEERKTPSFNAVAALKTLCSIEGLKIDYLERPTLRGIYNCEVEVSGRVLGKGSGQDWELAKHQAAEQAIRQLTSPSTNTSNDTSNAVKRNLPKIANSPSFHGKRMKFGDGWRPPTPSARGSRPPSRQWGRTPSFRR